MENKEETSEIEAFSQELSELSNKAISKGVTPCELIGLLELHKQEIFEALKKLDEKKD